MSTIVPLVLGTLTITLSLLSVVWLWQGRFGSTKQWVLQCFVSGNIALFIFLAGTWAFTSYYLRLLSPFLFIIAAVRSYKRIRVPLTTSAKPSFAKFIPAFLFILVFSLLNVLVIKGCYYHGHAVDLCFPLKSGVYYVLQGGNSPITNLFHSRNPKEKYAIDLVKLNRFGNRAQGVAPNRLEAYESFGEAVYSPCTGYVLTTASDLPDNPPGRPDIEHPEGNHVVLNCNGVKVFLAHMLRESIKVKAGDFVTSGQFIGQIGNSGFSSEPHLHISAAWTHAGVNSGDDGAVPIEFNRSFLVLNSIVSVR